MRLYNKDDWKHIKNWKHIDFMDSIAMASSGHLQPENLKEAKFILCLYQRFAEQYSPKNKKNRSIIQKALLTSTFEEFADVYKNIEDGNYWWLLCGLDHWLADLGLLLRYRITPKL
jgi:hypothetical protein